MKLSLRCTLLLVLLGYSLYLSEANIINNINWDTCSTNMTQINFFQVQDLQLFNTENQTIGRNTTTNTLFILKEQFMFNCGMVKVLLNTPKAFCVISDQANKNFKLIKFQCSENSCNLLQSLKLRDTAYITDLGVSHLALVLGPINRSQPYQGLIIVDTTNFKIVSDFDEKQTIFYSNPHFLEGTKMVYLEGSGGNYSQTVSMIQIDWKTQKQQPLGPQFDLNETGFITFDVLNKNTFIVENYQNNTFLAYGIDGNFLKAMSYDSDLPIYYDYNSSHLLLAGDTYMELVTFNQQSMEFEFTARTNYASQDRDDYLFTEILPNGNILMMAYYEYLEYTLEGNSFKVNNFQYCFTPFIEERQFIAQSELNNLIQMHGQYVILSQDSVLYTFDQAMNINGSQYLKKTDSKFKRAYLDNQRLELFSFYETFPTTTGLVYEFNYKTQNLQANLYLNMPSFWDNSGGRIFSILQNSDTNKPAFLYHMDIEGDDSKPVYAVFGNVATQILDSIYIDNLFANYDRDTQVVTLYFIIGNTYGTVGKVEFDMKTKSTINEKELSKHGSIAKVDNSSVLIADFDNNKVWLENTQLNKTAWSVDIPTLSNGGYLGYLGYDEESDDVIKGFIIVDKKGTRAISYDLKSRSCADLNIEKNDLDVSYRLYQSGLNQVLISVSRMDLIFNQYGYTYQEVSLSFKQTKLFLEKLDN